MPVFNSCPDCGRTALVDKQGDFTTDFSNKNGEVAKLVTKDMHWAECTACGEQVIDNAGLEKIEAARRNALGLLDRKALLTIRQGAGKTQGEMAELLGAGAKSYTRWESGSYLQSDLVDRFLRLLQIEPRNVLLLESIEQLKHLAAPAFDDLGEEFPDIDDFEDASQRAEVFTQVMICGALQVNIG